MFEWFKRKVVSRGPVTVDFDVAITKPAADVYALIDFADPRNAKRHLGEVRQIGPATFRMNLDLVPNMLFDITVTEASAPLVYAFSTVITPRPGRLLRSCERYEIEPDGSDACVLRLICEATFIDGLTEKQFTKEVEMISVAVDNALAKLKIHAEQGLDAVREIERMQTL